uniref:Uncharacterized protein n=1 Tax=Manihot esculenta TaxID=3983 RepID=A0A2C9VDE3_MANES
MTQIACIHLLFPSHITWACDPGCKSSDPIRLAQNQRGSGHEEKKLKNLKSCN